MLNTALNEENVQKILKVLEKAYPCDLSVHEIAERTGLHRVTVTSYIRALVAGGQIQISRKVGPIPLYQIVKTV